ncbi:MAG: CpsB/CapC family capsule biosynthesis tyrosine phosphatase [Christensenellales bacterium]|jgi:protein-tyrosine phosphatase
MTAKPTMRFIDIHHHIIYGVDDGPQTLEESKQMLALAYADGTRDIIATPHFVPMGCFPDIALLQERLAELNIICATEYPGLRLHLGAEVFFGEGVQRRLRTGIIPTLAGSDHVLVEFTPNVTKNNLENAIRHLTSGGYVVILAHSERYPAITHDIQFLQYIKEKYGTLIQVNADTFLSRQSFFLKRFLKKTLQLGTIDFIASDAHGTQHRVTKLSSTYNALLMNHDKLEVLKMMRNTANNLFIHRLI